MRTSRTAGPGAGDNPLVTPWELGRRVPGLPPLFPADGVRVLATAAGAPPEPSSLSTPWSSGDIRLPARAGGLPDLSGLAPVVLPGPRPVAERSSSALR